MAFISVTGEPAARHEELARAVAQQLRFELVTESKLAQLLAEEFGEGTPIPDRAFRPAVSSILARLATAHPLVVAVPGAEFLFPRFPGALRVHLTAPESRRIGNLMLDRRLERRPARELLGQLTREQKADRKKKFGKTALSPAQFDLILNAETFSDAAVAVVAEAARAAGLLERDSLLSPSAAAQLQFQLRLELARDGMVPAEKVSLQRTPFGHPSEEMFANLLDFYRIAWKYEPRSFPLQWDKDGNVIEAFTPDFYLPEADLYIELTTMKQTLVTKKNRKIRLLREIYPHINIQVFYQKDFQDLVFKYGLPQHASTL